MRRDKTRQDKAGRTKSPERVRLPGRETTHRAFVSGTGEELALARGVFWSSEWVGE